MAVAVIDHIFVCTGRGAPAAEILKRAGLTEGSPNSHPGQGTACRRFFFTNFMLELLWLEDDAEARGQQTRPTRLWERLSGIGMASPFGVVLRPEAGSAAVCPWPSWSYRPQAMPGLELEIATDAEMEEPMWCYMKTGRAPADWPAERRQPLDHAAGFAKMTGIRIGCPSVRDGSVTGQMARQEVIELETGVAHRVEVEFDQGEQGRVLDFRPVLPLVVRGMR